MAEPGKAELRAFDDGGPPPPRRAEVICLQRSNNATYKSVVSLTDDRVESFEHIPGVQANFTVDEFVECDQLLRTHPDFIAALAKRGITDMDLVFFDTWTYGERSRRRSTATGRTCATHPAPVRTTDVVERPADLTVEWLTAALGAYR